MKRPEDIWDVDEECAEHYEHSVRLGRLIASEASACVVGIARNAMPYLPNTLSLVDELRDGFRDFQMYVYENDSTDGTAEYLNDFMAAHPWFHVRHDTLGGADERGFQPERTVRLAHCRNQCHDYVRRHAADSDFVIVLDLDPHYGFSVDGVFTSVQRLLAGRSRGGMASYSLWSKIADDRKSRQLAHYDAWAARPVCWWRDRRNEVGFAWFSAFLPPVGAPVMPMNSAFGGLCVYRTEAFLAAGENPYQGGDCEHVFLHSKMADAGWSMYLNPGCRYVAVWEEA